ncbi:MAG: hypothetical protein A2114_02550 [Candidatus Vogelbacteria bacterium GWA1_51_14]|uniref:DNA polymerase III subunit delta n=1 Tax=Candidatus Vogelbacteria bacterium GWA1_51_14 TaxID=1802435 RepID=A0A1G2QAZ2_9BACT|nr:MAG: hypothetical protein A2114_02550 [Candidatus Vogelbacteria bacterium GWA1_51_14]
MTEALAKEMLDPAGGFIHHAFWLPGEWRELLPVVKKTILAKSVVTEADIAAAASESFLVDHSRQLKGLTGGALVGQTRCFLVAFDRINEDAQQALLKLLEEPPTGAIFILMAPEATIFLPTIISRLVVIKLGLPKGGAPVPPSSELSERAGLLTALANREQVLAKEVATLSPGEARLARQALANTRRWLARAPHAAVRSLKDYLDLTASKV